MPHRLSKVGSISKRIPGKQPRLMRLRQILEVIPVSRSTWLRGVQAGTIPAPVYMGRTPLWRSDDVDRLIETLEGK
jgi:prophage regulatory protein